jgi:hypothetical protein
MGSTSRLPIGGTRKNAQVFTSAPRHGSLSPSRTGVLLPMTTDLPFPDEPSPGLVLYTSPDGYVTCSLKVATRPMVSSKSCNHCTQYFVQFC